MEKKYLLRKALSMFLTIFLLILFTILIFVGSIEIMDNYYSFLYPYTIGTDDLGAPMFSTFWTVIITIISFPLSAISSHKIANKISNYLIKE